MTRSRKRLVVGICVGCALVAGAVAWLAPPVYRGETIFRIQRGKDKELRDKDLISAKELVDMVGNVRSPEKRAAIFQAHTRFIRELALSELKGSPDKFRVVIESERADAIEPAFAELAVYLNHNPLLERSVHEYRALLRKQIDELELVIKQSTEMRAAFEKMLASGRLLPVGFNPVDLSRRVADLHVEKLSFEQAMADLSGVEAVERIFIMKKPATLRIAWSVVLGGLAGLVIGMGVVRLASSEGAGQRPE